jgi:hypothetical protein
MGVVLNLLTESSDASMPISGHPWVACAMRTKQGSDPHIRKHFAAWFFTYDTGNPIAYAAARLRQALCAAVERFDPDGKDPCGGWY